MPERLTQHTAVIEGRAPIPAYLMPDGLPQPKTRQTELPKILADEGVGAVFVDAQDSATYDASGRIRTFTPYGATEPINGILEPGSYAWRLRDITWQGGDWAAYPDGDGYNSAKARYELSTRDGFRRALQEMGLEAYGVETITEPQARDWAAEKVLFVKPNVISDISDIGKDPGTRARLVDGRNLGATLAERFAGGAVLQRPEPLLPFTDLLDHLDIEADSPKAGYLHAIRVFSLAGVTPAVELRLTDPRSDVGKLFATELHLLEPELVFGGLPALADVHDLVRNAFAARYGENNYFAFDYIIRQDGSVKVLNALVRALTPNLPKQGEQDTETGRLATATAEIEGKYLAKLAIARFGAS